MSQSALHYEQGKLCYQNKKFNDAIFQFTEALRLGPDNVQAEARAYNARGVVYFYLGDFRKVVKDCTQALALDPTNANYYNCRGNAFFSLGKFSRAADDFAKAIELSPQASHGRYWNNLGSARRRLKDFKQAISDYTKAISVDPKNGNYYNNRGNTYFDAGEFQKAIDDFTTALGLEPYSAKTKLTLAQAQEALAQEKRMKNVTRYTGTYEHLKAKKGDKDKYRKKRVVDIFVSPLGVEVQFTHGSLIKKKDHATFQWAETMKIELTDDATVRLYVDEKQTAWIDFHPVKGTEVEEELIGRITTKFASYSTACLVAQHEAVVQEYTDIVKTVKQAADELRMFESILAEGEKQLAEYVAQQKFDLAEKSKAQKARLEATIAERRAIHKAETDRAEGVRAKAELEAGPVLDMVLIMQNRVRELYETKVAGVRDRYRVEDLELEEQLARMEELVKRARELGQIVAKPVSEAQEDLPLVHDDEEDEKSDSESAAASSSVSASQSSSSISAAAAAAGGAAAGGHDSDSDWEMDEDALPEDFKPVGAELFMSVETNGMITFTPADSALAHAAASGNAGTILRRGSLVNLTGGDAGNATDAAHAHEHSTEAMAAAHAAEDAAARAEIEALQAKLREAESKAEDRREMSEAMKRTNEQLEQMRNEADQLRAALKQRIEQVHEDQKALEGNLQQSDAEKQRLAQAVEDQRQSVAQMAAHLEKMNSELLDATRSAAERANALLEAEQQKRELEAALAKKEQETQEERAARERLQEEYELRMSLIQQQEREQAVTLDQERRQKAELEQKLEMHEMGMAQLRQHLANVQADLERSRKEAEARAAQEAALKAKNEADQAIIEKMKAQALIEEQKRRALHNQIQEIKGNIRVYVRIRPNFEDSKQDHQCYEESNEAGTEGGIAVISPPERSATSNKLKSKRWDFGVDHVFWPDQSQEKVFEEISQLVQSAIDGFKVCVFAYGQTGAGKTFTMEGHESHDPSKRGVIPRTVEQIFKARDDYKERGWEYELEASFLEIYNTEIRDLLVTGADSQPHDIKLVERGTELIPTVTNLTVVPVSSAADVRPLLERAGKNRATSATASNSRSSRSHSVFRLTISGRNTVSGDTSHGVLNLVDLAGSERLDKSLATGDRMKETQAINSSLTMLGDVIAALASGAKHVPYRNSKLTFLLQDCFGGGSKTLMFINIAPELEHMQESLCSLRFGAKVHDCHVGAAKKTGTKGAVRKA